MIEFGGHRKEMKRRNKERSGLVKGVSLFHREGHWKNDCKYRQEWLKKKGQSSEADVASGVKDAEVLMTSYIEHNTSHSKSWIFDLGSTIHVCPKKSCSTPWLQKRKGLSRWGMARLAKSSALGQSRLQKEMGHCVL